MPFLRSFSFRPLDVPLVEPFGIAQGVQQTAKNVLIELVLDDGTLGLGEAAPFPDVNGETQQSVLDRLLPVEGILREQNLGAYRAVSEGLQEFLADAPSALCGVEIALLDALCRSHQLSCRSFFGGKELRLESDVTIVTGDAEHAAESARARAAQGFRQFKVKVGGGDLDQDVRRLGNIHQAYPQCELVLDANASMTAGDALALLQGLGAVKSHVALFEQPTPAADLDALRQVERDGGVAVAADESLRSRRDFERIVKGGGISVVNIKTAKLGLVAAWDVLVAAQTCGLDVMVGGMVETELSMSASACLAAGVGGVRFVDLDTPLFMGSRPLKGGYVQNGPHLDLTGIELGHGVERQVAPGKGE